MAKKDKFEFVNDIKSDIDQSMTEPIKSKKEEAKEAVDEEKRYTKKRYFISFVVMLFISFILLMLVMIWQDEYTLMAWGDALWVVFVLEFFFGWMMLIYNLNILSPLIYGYKSLFLMFVGKKPKVGYYEYTQNIAQNQIPKYYIIVLFLSAFTIFIPALITLLILL